MSDSMSQGQELIQIDLEARCDAWKQIPDEVEAPEDADVQRASMCGLRDAPFLDQSGCDGHRRTERVQGFPFYEDLWTIL